MQINGRRIKTVLMLRARTKQMSTEDEESIKHKDVLQDK
jgi:hypothetical protein